ncbi:MAG: signal peptidase II [Myxococcota bacterium]|nr:signal peptidase II [Myxococcota bacterium]
MKPVLTYILLLFVLLAGCSSDLLTKKLATESLKDQPSVSVVNGYLDLKYAENEAAGFSLFRKVKSEIRKPLLVSMQLLGSIALCVFIYILRRNSFYTLLPYLVILSGALGNLIDRLQNGYVVDFIYFHVKGHFSWPIFNVADILIVIGVGLALIQVFFKGPAQLEQVS